MTFLNSIALASAAACAGLALVACETTDNGSVIQPATGAQAEVSNSGNLNSNGSVQPGGAGPSPTGGDSNPGTSGTISPKPGPGPH
jgi:hypothetical protein